MTTFLKISFIEVQALTDSLCDSPRNSGFVTVNAATYWALKNTDKVEDEQTTVMNSTIKTEMLFDSDNKVIAARVTEAGYNVYYMIPLLRVEFNTKSVIKKEKTEFSNADIRRGWTYINGNIIVVPENYIPESENSLYS